MNEKKIVVPEGMSIAVANALYKRFGATEYHPKMPVAIEAALRWLSENPIVPSDAQFAPIRDMWDAPGSRGMGFSQFVISEWQQQMFLAPEPEIPEAVKNLLLGEAYNHLPPSAETVNERIIEAFRRGQKSK